MSMAKVGRIRQMILLSILTWLVNCKLFRMIWCPETQMLRVIYPPMCLKGSGIRIHEKEHNCPPENVVYGQDWHSGRGIICTQILFMYTSRIMMGDYLSNNQKLYYIKGGRGANKRTSNRLASVEHCIWWNQWRASTVHVGWKSDQHKDCSAAQQQRNRHDSN